jgi:hypothetical protein
VESGLIQSSIFLGQTHPSPSDTSITEHGTVDKCPSPQLPNDQSTPNTTQPRDDEKHSQPNLDMDGSFPGLPHTVRERERREEWRGCSSKGVCFHLSHRASCRRTTSGLKLCVCKLALRTNTTCYLFKLPMRDRNVSVAVVSSLRAFHTEGVMRSWTTQGILTPVQQFSQTGPTGKPTDRLCLSKHLSLLVQNALPLTLHSREMCLISQLQETCS